MSKNGGGYGGPSAAMTAAAAAAIAVAAASAGTPVSNSTHWSTEETKLLIRTWGDYREEFAEIKRNLVVWNKVLERLLSAGFFRTVEQCRNRWKFLETKYKTAARDMGTAGNTAWEFFDDMDLAKRGPTRRRNSSASSAGMHRHLYESPSQSPSQQSSTLPASSSQPLAGAQTQKSLALFADHYGRVMLPPIRPTAAAVPPVASSDSVRSARHSSPALPAAASSSQHARLYQPRQDSPSAHYAYHQNKSSSFDNSYSAHVYPPSQQQYYEAVATSAPQPPPPQRLSPHLQQRQQQLSQQARQYRPPVGRGPPSQIQQQYSARRPASPPITFTHHPLAAGHLPESHPSTPKSASSSTSTDAHPYRLQAPPAMLMRQHVYPAAHGNAAYTQASPGPTEPRMPLVRTSGSTMQTKLGQEAPMPVAQRPSSTQPPAGMMPAQRDEHEHHLHRAMSVDVGFVEAPITRKRKLERTSMLFGSNNSETEHDGNERSEGSATNKPELVGSISRADLLSFLREQSEQRQQRESLRAEERRRSEDSRREEEWRFHEYQMSLMQLIQHSLAPFAIDDDANFEKGELADMASAPSDVSPRISGQREGVEGGVDNRDLQVFPVVEPRALGASAQNPAEETLACKARDAEEVEMQPRTPLPVANELDVPTSSPFVPHAEPSLA
ncbi:hypothetical protein IWW39_001844 [Coemansia spiralis]|uniref:Myb-like domain-containing protein n=1 Tax=Coemansia spiralis TaxID=417178 RepID=A0A9W8L454_9FUNG|nr:hypothetical protein IWW39_001844 [Coemansia spiralis]